MRTHPAAFVLTILLALAGHVAAQDTATIWGHVFEDFNVNGVLDPGEPPVPDVTMIAGGDSAITDIDGHYFFTVSAPGTHTIRIVAPPGYVNVTPESLHIECQPGWTLEINFGIVEPVPASAVFGTVFEDLNRNDVQDSTEAGLAGVTVEIVMPDATLSVNTNSAGAYGFALLPGEYTLIETNPPEYLSTTPDTVTFTVGPGETGQVDFGDRMIAEVSLDIKPGACPNRLNSKSGGFLGVAIAGTPTGEFYAAEIDPAAVRLGGVAPYLYSIKDVTSPYEPLIGKEGCDDCARSRSDGIADFQMRFDPDAIRSAIGPVTADTCVVLHLSGNFTDGFPFVGEDVLLLRVVGKPTVKNAPASGSSTISAWPNPVSEVTVVRFALAEPAMVRVTVHDMLGREVAVIAEGRYGAGPHTAQWDGTTGGGHPVGPGLYFVSIETGGHTSTSKIVVLE